MPDERTLKRMNHTKTSHKAKTNEESWQHAHSPHGLRKLMDFCILHYLHGLVVKV